MKRASTNPFPPTPAPASQPAAGLSGQGSPTRAGSGASPPRGRDSALSARSAGSRSPSVRAGKLPSGERPADGNLGGESAAQPQGIKRLPAELWTQVVLAGGLSTTDMDNMMKAAEEVARSPILVAKLNAGFSEKRRSQALAEELAAERLPDDTDSVDTFHAFDKLFQRGVQGIMKDAVMLDADNSPVLVKTPGSAARAQTQQEFFMENMLNELDWTADSVAVGYSLSPLILSLHDVPEPAFPMLAQSVAELAQRVDVEREGHVDGQDSSVWHLTAKAVEQRLRAAGPSQQAAAASAGTWLPQAIGLYAPDPATYEEAIGKLKSRFKEESDSETKAWIWASVMMAGRSSHATADSDATQAFFATCRDMTLALDRPILKTAPDKVFEKFSSVLCDLKEQPLTPAAMDAVLEIGEHLSPTSWGAALIVSELPKGFDSATLDQPATRAQVVRAVELSEKLDRPNAARMRGFFAKALLGKCDGWLEERPPSVLPDFAAFVMSKSLAMLEEASR